MATPIVQLTPLHDLLAKVSPQLRAEELDTWAHVRLQDGQAVSDELALRTAGSVAASVAASAAVARGATDGLEEHATTCCLGLAAFDAVLACASPAVVQKASAQLLPHLDAAYDHLAKLASEASAELLLSSTRSSTGEAPSAAVALRRDALRWPFLVLARCCTEPACLTWRHVLELARNDLLTSISALLIVACSDAVACVDGQPLLPPAWLRIHSWRILHQLTSPQCGVELRTGMDFRNSNETPIADLLARQVAHAHCIALCLVQLCAVDALFNVRVAESFGRASVFANFLMALHNLVASPQLAAPAEMLGRHLAVRWRDFGMRCLAPHLRRCLNTASSGQDDIAMVAARALRHDLRTFGWLLYHARALREQASALCVEICLRVLREEHTLETAAIAILVAANAGEFSSSCHGALNMAMCSMAPEVKVLLTAEISREARQRLWPTKDAVEAMIAQGVWTEGVLAQTAASNWTSVATVEDAPIVSVVHEGFVFEVAFPGFDDVDTYVPDTMFNDYSDGMNIGNTNDEDFDGWEEVEEWFGDEGGCVDGGVIECGEWNGPCAASLPLPVAPAWVPLARISGGPATPPPTVLLCEAPRSFRCSLDARLCSDPVRSPRGVLFDRANLLSWLRWRRTCPVSGLPLAPEELQPDVHLTEAIPEWLRRGGGLCGA